MRGIDAERRAAAVARLAELPEAPRRGAIRGVRASGGREAIRVDPYGVALHRAGCRWAAADGAAPCVLSESGRESVAYFHGNFAALRRARSRRSWTCRACVCVWPGRAAWGSAVPLPGTCAAPRAASRIWL